MSCFLFEIHDNVSHVLVLWTWLTSPPKLAARDIKGARHQTSFGKGILCPVIGDDGPRVGRFRAHSVPHISVDR